MTTKFYPNPKNLAACDNEGQRSSSEKPFYYYIKNGNFDLVWTNIVIFIVGHLLFIQCYYDIITKFGAGNPANAYTLIFGE